MCREALEFCIWDSSASKLALPCCSLKLNTIVSDLPTTILKPGILICLVIFFLPNTLSSAHLCPQKKNIVVKEQKCEFKKRISCSIHQKINSLL